MRFEIRHRRHREEFSTKEDFVVFGRDPSCDVVIRDPRCSRRHASIRVVPEGYHLLDMGSSNGLFVFGQRVDDAVIAEGDVFSMGDVFVRILPEDMPPTLAGGRDDATVVQAPPRPVKPPPRAPEAQPQGVGLRPQAPPEPSKPIAGKVLGGSSLLVGLALIAAPMTLRSQLGLMSYVSAALGVFAAVAGLGLLRRLHWARKAHYVLFTICTLTCLLAPFGIVGFAYQLEGEDRPATDPFFAVVIGLAAGFVTLAVVVATLAAGLYVPAPLPL